MKNFLLNFLDYIYKKPCYFCKSAKSGVKMCDKCFDEMELKQTVCNKIINGCNIYIAGVYEKNLQKLIRGLKYHKQKDLAYYQAKFMCEFFKQLDISKKQFEIIPVPLYKTRRKKRGYNHMELVAIEFSKLSGFDYNFNLIERIKDTKPQYNLKTAQRKENLKNAFKINLNAYNNLPILLIDDITTTGTTFEQIILEFQKSNIYDITCFATTGVNCDFN
jgi:ComF family protein